MGLLERWRPLRELDRFRDELDDLMERFGFERDWFRFPLSRELFGGGEALARRAVGSASSSCHSVLATVIDPNLRRMFTQWALQRPAMGLSV